VSAIVVCVRLASLVLGHATPNGERVAWGMGPAYGMRPQSYRAEGYGLLSILRFLIRMAEFTEKTDPWSGIIGTDSLSVLDTLQGKVQAGVGRDRMHAPIIMRGEAVVLDTLSADWDVLVEIQYAMTQLPGIQLQYVKGHQDRTTAVARLPLLAQLNVEADTKAGLYQDGHGANHPVVFLTPRTRAHLHFNTGTVTSRYPAALQKEHSSEALLHHIRTRNHWTAATAAFVNWDSHGAALSKHIQNRLHYSKMVHDILPTLAYLNKQDNGKRLCPCCRHPHETRDHILRCPAPARNRWRHSFLTSLDGFCSETNTAPGLKQLLLDIIREWLYCDQAEDFQPDLAHQPPLLHVLIQQQTAIGWRQLFNGRFSEQWRVIQEGHLHRTLSDSTSPTGKITGALWQTKLILFIWKQWRLVWKLRNESLHGKDTVEIYDLRSQMEPSVQSLLCTDIHQHLLKPTWATTNWLHIHVPLFQASLR
jgi:hypothetical protein